MKVKKVLNKLSDRLAVRACTDLKHPDSDPQSDDVLTTEADLMDSEPSDGSSPEPQPSTSGLQQTVSPVCWDTTPDPPVSPNKLPKLERLKLSSSPPINKSSLKSQTPSHSSSQLQPFEIMANERDDFLHVDFGGIDLLAYTGVNCATDEPNVVTEADRPNGSTSAANSGHQTDLNNSVQNESPLDFSDDAVLQQLLDQFASEPNDSFSQYLATDVNLNFCEFPDRTNISTTVPIATNQSNQSNTFVFEHIVADNKELQSGDQTTESTAEQSNTNTSTNARAVQIDLSDVSDSTPNTPVDGDVSHQTSQTLIANHSQRAINETSNNLRQSPVNGVQKRTNSSHMFVRTGSRHTFISNSAQSQSQSQSEPLLRTLLEEPQPLSTLPTQSPLQPHCSNAPTKVKSLRHPFNYCAKDYRVFNLTRSSNRNKSSAQNEEHDYDVVKDLSWNQLDGSQYEAKVKKWNEEDMNEDRRKEILRSVQDEDNKKFSKSVYEADYHVFYWFRAFNDSYVERGVAPRGELRCVVLLTNNAVKHQRFTKYETRLFVLVGTVFVIIENGKQKKTAEVGHEIAIPAHTKYGLENKTADDCYLYCILSNN